MSRSVVRVNQSIYPPREILERYLNRLFEGQRDNENGWLQIELERQLAKKLSIEHVFFTANGTMALLLSLLALNQKGKVVLSAFSHPSTVNAVIAAGLTPKFCDVEPKFLCIDPVKLAEVIDDDTVAVLATHIYGNACEHGAISKIVQVSGVKLLYDASHAFGSIWRGKPLVSYGDVSALSLQAFKVFNSVEGGLVLTDDDEIAERIYRYRFFGKDRANEVVCFGLNGKGSDLHAAVALANLEILEETIECRNANFREYHSLLDGARAFRLYEHRPGLIPNYAYLPVIFNDAQSTVAVLRTLEANGIIARRYFHPSLNTLPFVQAVPCPISERISTEVICLPVHQGVTCAEINYIAELLHGCVER